MAAFLYRIQLPSVENSAEDDKIITASEDNDRPSDSSGEAGVIRNDDRRGAALASDPDETNSNFFCYHAIALGSTVMGNLPSRQTGANISSNDGDRGYGAASLWQTSFGDPILALASNTSGTIIASASATHVSLLKGRDGSIIATRQITRSDDSAIMSPGLVFVTLPSNQCSHHEQQVPVKDVLLIVCPVNIGEWDKSNVIIISNIDGDALNSSQLDKFREGATNMSINALCFDDGDKNNNNFAAGDVAATLIQGVFISGDIIRFFIAHKSGTISVHDYNTMSRKSTFVTEDLFQHIGLGTWKFEEHAGMTIDANNNRGMYLVLAASKKSVTSIGWINVRDISISANCPIAAGEKLVSLKPLRSNHPDECVAVAFSTKNTQSRKRAESTSRIYVVQSLLGKDGHSQVLFTVESDNRAIEICSPPASFASESYSFRFAGKFNGDNSHVYNQFIPNEQGRVGTVHYLVAAKNYFDDALNIITEELSNYSCNDAISTPIHKSLVWLWKFRHILSTWDNDASCEEYQQCLRQLTFGAATGDDMCTENMIAAAEFMLHWPMKCSNVENAKHSSVSLLDIQSKLSLLCSEMKKVIEVIRLSPKHTHLAEQHRKLNSKLRAIQGLECVTTLDGSQIQLNDAYLSVGSIDGLLSILITQGAFLSAERLQKSDYGKSLTPDSISSAALRIPLQSDPTEFLPWLCDFVIPALHIGHPMLDCIRAWACKAAEFYDEEDIFRGIESSIKLLMAVSKSTTDLSVAMYGFSAHSVAIENESLPANDKVVSTSIHHHPSVLKVGMIRGRKIREGRTFSAQRVVTTEASTATLPPSCDLDYHESIEHDCVEQKLDEATRLKRARDLGMDKYCLLLSGYKSKGDHYVVKELLKSALTRTSVPSTSALDVEGVRQFAKDVDVDLDNAMHQLSIELGDSKKDEIPYYLQDATRLAQWCRSPSVMCRIVLRMLQKALVSIQRPPDLSRIADSAIESATDDNIKSELKEAARLLSIDYLVRKYCGNGAQEYFRVSNPTHGIRLVQHVCRHIDVDSVLSDVLLLCDAFKDISVANASFSLLKRVMISRGKCRVGQCAHIMTTLYSRDALLATAVGERATRFCAETLEDCKKLILQNLFAFEAKKRAKQIVQVACSILSVMVHEAKKKGRIGDKHADTLMILKKFEIMSRLQLDCEIFLTLEEAENSSSCVSVVLELLNSSVDSSFSQKSLESSEILSNKFHPLIRKAKNWCATLCNYQEVEKVWSYAVGTVASQIADTSGGNANVLLEVSGVFEEGHGAYIQSIIAVALTLCNKAISQTYQLSSSTLSKEDSLSDALTAMKNMVRASHLLRTHAMISSPGDVLPEVLSVATLIELICDVSARSDFGVGERLEKEIALLHPTLQKSSFCHKALPPSPILHPSWYIGDGLLLQPIEALFGCVSYCQSVSQLEPNGISFSSDHKATTEIVSLLEANGAHSTSLRLLAHSNSTALSIANMSLFDSEILMSSKAFSAGRSLGGTDAGLTSGNIDSLLAVSILLHLPKETAFKIYQASLPSAICNRDCTRILALASIGSYLGVGAYSSGVHFSWRTQQRFVDQCNDLFRNSLWWKIFSSYDISFDPSVFSKYCDSTAKETMQSYCEQLVLKATNILGPNSVLRLTRKFGSTYGLDKYCPASALVKFLLTPPVVSETNSQCSDPNHVHDIRYNLVLVENEVRSVLVFIPILNQVKILRKCVSELEKDEHSAKDYDLQATTLLLYRECLAKLDTFMKKSDSRKKAHDEEMGRIERRQDALVILSSIFDNYSVEGRPEYSKMFQPLPDDPLLPLQNSMLRRVGVLGSFAQSDTFDSLAPLHDVLGKMSSNEVLGALDISLCPLLQLPTGYIHARSLIIKLNKMISAGEDLPSFEHAVAPVIKKLEKADDKADLAWWCSQQYCMGSNDQLKCLDLAYTNATLASDEVESLGQRSDERVALDRVQRIDSARAGLSDKVLVEEVLHRHDLNANVKVLYKEILCDVQTIVNANSKYSPELLVRELLIQGSLTAALSALDNCHHLTISGFRSLALVVHDACQSLAERYSHVSVGKIARHLMRQWLAHGDETISDDVENCYPEETVEGEAMETSVRKEDVEEETSEFVINMSMISSNEQSWTNGSTKNASGLSSSEEPSSIKPLSSSKEQYDQMNSRAALRIAFLISFVKDFHRQNDLSEDDDENTDTNIKPKKSIMKTKKQRASFFEGDLAMYHARELLSIVFAMERRIPTSSFRPLFDESVSYDNSILSTIQEDHSYTKEDSRMTKKVISFSFAMRHRAMRVVSILCPRDVMLRVLTEEGHVSKTAEDVINKYMFGSFVAMEMESMGLPLPHSNLIQLSSMNFASYARTIWRHHGGVSSRGLSGRFYLLVLSLCINNRRSIDWELVLLIFGELKRLELTRSLLLACEGAVQSKAIELAALEGRTDILSCVGDAIDTISSVVINEIKTNMEAGLEQSVHDCLSTLDRLVSVIITEAVQVDPISFVGEYMAMSSYCEGKKHIDFSRGFSDVAARIATHLTGPQQFSSGPSESEQSMAEKKVESSHLKHGQHQNSKDFVE